MRWSNKSNAYVPPDSDEHFFKSLFAVIASESELCAGDFNVILDHRIDTTSTKRNETHFTKIMNTYMKEQGLVDVWRELHPL